FLQWRDGGRWSWIGYPAIALGVLTKGPVALALPAASMLGFLAWQRDFRAIRKLRPLSGLLLIVAITVPWFGLMIARVPGYFEFFFVGEHLRRTFEASYSHGEPVYFYLPVLAIGLLPWSMLVPFLTWRTLEPNPARAFCVISAMIVLIAFSLANAKLISYV